MVVLSWWERVSLFWRVPLILIQAFCNFILTLVWKNPWPTLPWKQRCLICFLRSMLLASPLSPRQRQWVQVHKTTSEALHDFCSKNKITRTVKTVDTGNPDFPAAAQLHFVTPDSPCETGPTLYYFHGGGYSEPMIGIIHTPLILRCAAACRARQIVVLEYGLTPEFKYPTQLVQAVAGLRHLLAAEGIPPSKLVIGGDSAGGGVLAALLLHVVRPCPYAAPVDLGGERFRGVFFLSPWVVISTDQPSHENNARMDWVGRQGVGELVEWWSPRLDEVWAAPCEAEDAKASWEAVYSAGGDDSVAAKSLVTAGTAEVFHDGIVGFGTEFIKARTTIVDRETDLTNVVDSSRLLARCVDESHVHMGIDVVVKRENGAGWRVLDTWLQSL